MKSSAATCSLPRHARVKSGPRQLIGRSVSSGGMGVAVFASHENFEGETVDALNSAKGVRHREAV